VYSEEHKYEAVRNPNLPMGWDSSVITPAKAAKYLEFQSYGFLKMNHSNDSRKAT